MDPILARNLERYGITVHRPRPRRARRLRQGRPPGPGSHRSPRRRPAPRAPEGAPRRVSPPFAFGRRARSPRAAFPESGAASNAAFEGLPAGETPANRLQTALARGGRVRGGSERVLRGRDASHRRSSALPERGDGPQAALEAFPAGESGFEPLTGVSPAGEGPSGRSGGDPRAPDPREAGRQATPARESAPEDDLLVSRTANGEMGRIVPDPRVGDRSISLCAFASLRESSFESLRKDAKGACEQRYGRPPSAATRPKAFR